MLYLDPLGCRCSELSPNTVHDISHSPQSLPAVRNIRRGYRMNGPCLKVHEFRPPGKDLQSIIKRNVCSSKKVTEYITCVGSVGMSNYLGRNREFKDISIQYHQFRFGVR